MTTCSTCGGDVPEVMKGDICPECLGIIIANSMAEDEDHDEFEPEDDGYPLPTEPDDEDYVTSDYVFFYRHGFRSNGPIVIVRAGCNWAKVVESRMNQEKFWPNVWYIGERGDVNLIDMYEELHSEEQ